MKIEFIVVTQFRETLRDRGVKTVKGDKGRIQSGHIHIVSIPQKWNDIHIESMNELSKMQKESKQRHGFI